METKSNFLSSFCLFLNIERKISNDSGFFLMIAHPQIGYFMSFNYDGQILSSSSSYEFLTFAGLLLRFCGSIFLLKFLQLSVKQVYED